MMVMAGLFGYREVLDVRAVENVNLWTSHAILKRPCKFAPSRLVCMPNDGYNLCPCTCPLRVGRGILTLTGGT